MGIRTLVLGLMGAASLGAQHHFNWQDACFANPGAPFCSGHDFAVKPVKPAKDASTPSDVVTNPVPSTPQPVAPALIVVGRIDWRFADPSAQALAGFNFSDISVSPIARNLIGQLGAAANQGGLNEGEVQKIFDSLSGADQVVASVRDNGIVFLITGSATENAPTLEPGWKAVRVVGNAMLIGQEEAVDQAAQRISMGSPRSELTRLAEQLSANSEFWAVGSGQLAGPQAVSAGVKRFSLAMAIRDRLTSEAVFEFNQPPDASMLRAWPATYGTATIEGRLVHARMSMEAGEMQQRFSQIAASPLGQNLAALVKSARNLPACCALVTRHTKAVIYGLDSGPKEVK